MRGGADPAGALRRLASYPHHALTWVDERGYPQSVVVRTTIDAAAGIVRIDRPAGVRVPPARELSLTGSHIRPMPGYGYDERRHLTVWGLPEADDDLGRLVVRPVAVWGWDEAETPFFEYAERSVGQSKRYLTRLSADLHRVVRPRLDLGWLILRATRLPFLSATLVPILLGIAVAAAAGSFDPPSALLTIVGGCAVQLGLNVANDVFDTQSGADDFNVNPTPYSGGSRVIQYGLVSFRAMALLAAALVAAGAAIGLVLLAARGSAALLLIGLVGLVVGIAYTAPPLRLAYHGLGELAVGFGFGPLMLLGAYVVQTGGAISASAVWASLPVAILVALILYVNEIPDRPADAAAGKRTLPVRFGRGPVLRGYRLAAGATFGIIVMGAGLGLLPLTALVAVVAYPAARGVASGLARAYDQPYALMPVMASQIQLHLVVGGLLVLAFVASAATTALVPGARLFLSW